MIKRICLLLLLGLAGLSFGQTGTVTEIVVQGNQNITTEAIQTAMRTKVGQPYSQAQLNQDRRSIEEMGFFQAVDVQARLIEEGSWQVVVTVSELPIIREVRIVGNTVISNEAILQALTIKPGQVFNLKSVPGSIEAIRNLYTERGYFINFNDFGPLEDSPGTLNIEIIEFTVDSITITGNTRTKDWVFRRLIKTEPGEPFNAQRWQRDVGRLISTQWFEEVNPEATQSDEELGRVNLRINVKEGRTGQFTAGVQLDPRSSFAGIVRLADTNFRGTGQTLGVNFLQGTAGGGASVDFDYLNPWIDRRDTSLSASIYSRLIYRFAGNAFGGGETPIEDDRYTERRTGGQVVLTRPFQETLFGSVGARFETINTLGLRTDDSSSPGTDPGFIQQDGDVGVLSFGLTRNRRDLDVDPSRGDWMRAIIEPGYSNIRKVGGSIEDNRRILGSNTFIKTNLEYRGYFSPGQPPRSLPELDASRRVIAVRARYGNIGGEVPFFEQFFAGGSETVRGYQEDRFWGRESLIFNFEYRHPIQRAFNAIAFVDYGGAWGGYRGVRNFTQSNSPKLHLGYGIGFSFRTPLGPIRLDFGFNENGGSRTHFLIGTSF